MEKRKWIIWGAGKNGKRIYKLLKAFGVNIVLFVDDNKNLHGTYIGNVLIGSIDQIEFIHEYSICISVQGFYETIRDYLICQFNLKETQIFHYATCIFETIKIHLNLFKELPLSKEKLPEKMTILFECGDGLGLGGIETWNLTFGTMLLKKGYCVKYLMPEDSILDIIDSYVLIKDCKNFKDGWNVSFLKKVVQQIVNQLPCIFIASHLNASILAAYAVKQLYPSDIKIISVVHGGNKSILEWNCKIEPYVDTMIGVAENGICNKLRNYGISSDKILRVVCPITCSKYLERNYSRTFQPIKLGYAARLEINDKDKRVDYLIPLIDRLEKSKIEYVLSIAGKGNFESILKDYVKKNNLKDHVKLVGYLDRNKMPYFWSEQDVFINLSDSEGNCMSMLEAMAQGNVPVLTDVSGVRDSIIDGENGFIVNCGDMDAIVEKIIFLFKKRELLYSMGMRAHQKIKEQYNEKDILELFETRLLYNFKTQERPAMKSQV